MSNDILHAIATEAASLIENARLVQAEEAGRRYQQELSIAASIQQRLMAVTIPEVPFAKLAGRNLSCKEIGGDFFDAVNTDQGLTIVLADVSGKGVSAALLASTLQGMIYSQLTAGMPLTEIVTAVNRFFTDKNIGEKYATVIIARVRDNGDLEYVNCGHVQPLVVSKGEVWRPAHGNLPVGLLPDAKYESDHCQLKAGDRLGAGDRRRDRSRKFAGRFLRRLAPGARRQNRIVRTNLYRDLYLLRRYAPERRLHRSGTGVHRQLIASLLGPSHKEPPIFPQPRRSPRLPTVVLPANKM